jgi:N,N'-diacetyllegionaminate synthase
MTNSYLYTETAFHHEGDMDFLLKLIDDSKESGANGIKFQVLTKAEDFISSKHSAFESLKGMCFTLAEWERIFAYANKKKLELILMPLNSEALNLVQEFPVKYIDIHSVSFNDHELLEKIKKTGNKVIIGIGGRTIDEIVEKSLFFEEKLAVIMTGFQSFPSDIQDVGIGKIKILRELFPSIAIGYADHSSYNNIFCIKSNEYARLLGATIFEKHITIQEGMKRTDFQSAVNKQKIKEIITNLAFIDQYILNSATEQLSMKEAERKYRMRQAVCVALKNLDKGTVLKSEDICLKMIDNRSCTFSDISSLVGKTLNKNIEVDDAITLSEI